MDQGLLVLYVEAGVLSQETGLQETEVAQMSRWSRVVRHNWEEIQ